MQLQTLDGIVSDAQASRLISILADAADHQASPFADWTIVLAPSGARKPQPGQTIRLLCDIHPLQARDPQFFSSSDWVNNINWSTQTHGIDDTASSRRVAVRNSVSSVTMAGSTFPFFQKAGYSYAPHSLDQLFYFYRELNSCNAPKTTDLEIAVFFLHPLRLLHQVQVLLILTGHCLLQSLMQTRLE